MWVQSKYGVVLCFTLAIIGSSAAAIGFESAIPFGARSAGVAGIATPYMSGAQSLFFNPAGLAVQKGQSVSLQDSPTWVSAKAPIDDQNDISKTSSFSPPGGLFYSNSPSDRWGLGVGYYVAGGSNVAFDNVNISDTYNYGGTADVSTRLQLMELSVGAAYKVNDHLKVGLAWRALFADASFAIAQRGEALGGTVHTLANIEMNNLSGSNYGGLRVGAQYQIDESTTIGLTYRSEMNIKAKGNYDGKVMATNPAAAGSIDQTHAEALTTLPQAVNVGVLHNLNDHWKLLGEYDWVNYSRVNQITLNGAITYKGGTSIISDPADLHTDWSDQHLIRIGAEYLGWALPLRFGYAWSSQVVPTDLARPTTTPPGMGHALTAGTSYTIAGVDLDGALEYSLVQGHGNGAEAGQTGTGTDTRAGTYSLASLNMHLGVSYSF